MPLSRGWAVRLVATLVVALVSLGGAPAGFVPALGPAAVQAQDLAERMRAARLRAQARLLAGEGDGTARVLPPDRIDTPQIDSTRALLRRAAGLEEERPAERAEAQPFPIRGYNQMTRLSRSWFEKEFADVQWAFLGNEGVTTLDTTYTRILRARMEAAFGAPTVTLVDRISRAGARPRENVQFEYWFVVNDTIPLIVMDTGGPYDRGLVVSSDARYQAQLLDIRRAFLAGIATSPERAPYVDYYYEETEDQWYRTGFDGTRFFLEPVSGRRVLPDRRPWLEEQ